MLPATAYEDVGRPTKLPLPSPSHLQSTAPSMPSPAFFGTPSGEPTPAPPPADDPELSEAAKQRDFVPPRVIPARQKHTHSFIVLHGRGGEVDMFAAQFLSAKLSTTAPDGRRQMLGGCFPGARYIFPEARLLPLARSGEKDIHTRQWFDVWDQYDRETRTEVQHDGLRDTSAFLRWIVEYEARKVGVRRVIIVGLSQGAAAGLHLLLGLECGVDLDLRPPSNGETHAHGDKSQMLDQNSNVLGGAVIISGWLPLASDIAMAALPDEADEFDSRWRSPAEKGLCEGPEGAAQLAADDSDLCTRQYGAANFAREVAELEALTPDLQRSPGFAQTPVFIGHGTMDRTVPVHLAVRARDLLVRLGVNVRWKKYEYWHWWKEPEEIHDIVDFLQEECGVPLEDAIPAAA